VSDGFDGVEPAWSLNFRFAGQYCSVWQIKAGTRRRFQDTGNHRHIGLLDLWIVYGVLKDDWVIILANSIGASLSLAVLGFKIRDLNS
jgi:hypothetical protein